MSVFLPLWIMGKASILLLEDRWFDSPGLHTEPQTAPDVLVCTLPGSHRYQCVYVWITVSHFGQKNVNVNVHQHYNLTLTAECANSIT